MIFKCDECDRLIDDDMVDCNLLDGEFGCPYCNETEEQSSYHEVEKVKYFEVDAFSLSDDMPLASRHIKRFGYNNNDEFVVDMKLTPKCHKIKTKKGARRVRFQRTH